MRTIASYNPGGTGGAEVDNVNIVGSNIYLFYADDNPSLDDISALQDAQPRRRRHVQHGGNLSR